MRVFDCFVVKITHRSGRQLIQKVPLQVLVSPQAVGSNTVYNLILESWRPKLVSSHWNRKSAPVTGSWAWSLIRGHPRSPEVRQGYFLGHVNPETLEMLDEEEIKMKESLVEEWFIYRIYNFEKRKFSENFREFLPKKFFKMFWTKVFGDIFETDIANIFSDFL